MQTMRTPLVDHKSSASRTRAGSIASARKYIDDTSDSAHHSSSDRESRSSGASSPDGSESDTLRTNKAHKPINDAVTSALTQATGTTHTTLAPEVLNAITSQITASVLQQLQTKNINVPATALPEQHDLLSTSDDISRNRVVYTPPSPDDPAAHMAQSQTSPTFSNFSMGSTDSQQPPSPKDRRPLSPFSAGSGHDDSDDSKRHTRPQGPKRSSTYGDTTALERAWGKMYDKDGIPTERLSQFLRGVALHLIEDYEPKNSLVITPEKMQRYYLETKLPNEIYPWQAIFDDKESRISRMLRELGVQHHLIQDERQLEERPDIPGITPRGFEAWMKIVLKARPGLEYERLAKTALHMPISNADDRKERFPKELSKRLFAIDAESSVATKLDKAITTHCQVSLPPRRNSLAAQAPRASVASQRRSGNSPPAGTNLQQSGTAESNSSRHLSRSGTIEMSSVQGSAIQDDFAEGAPAMPIERERKPYTAQPGIGKQYEGADGNPASRMLSNIETINLPPPPSGKAGRSPSVASAGGTAHRSRTLPATFHNNANPSWDNQDTLGQSSQSRYQPARRSDRNRSPSESRSKGHGRRSEGHFKTGSYESGRSDYEPVTYSTHAPGRHSRRSSFNDGKDRTVRDRERDRDRSERDREPRSRVQSMSSTNEAEEGFYRNFNPGAMGSEPGHSAYPPNAYRTKDEQSRPRRSA